MRAHTGLLLALGTLLGGCFDLFGTYEGGSAGAGGSPPTGGNAMGAGGAGGSGGAPSCPEAGYTFKLSLADSYLHARAGAVSPVTGKALVVGAFGDTVTLAGATLSPIGGYENFFALLLDGTGAPTAAVSAHQVLADSPTVRHVVDTPDGGFVLSLRGRGATIPSAVTIPGQDDSDVTDALVIKIDPNGSIAWAMLLEGGPADLVVDLVKPTADGLLLGGHTDGAVLTRRATTALQEVVDDSTIAASLFLLDLDADGVQRKLTRWNGQGTLAGVEDIGGSRYLFGSYSGPFPGFGNSIDIPSDANPPSLFVVELEADGRIAARQKRLGFPERDTRALGLQASDGDLILFGDTHNGATIEGIWPGTTAVLPVGLQGSFVARLDASLDPSWVHLHEISSPNTVAHSFATDGSSFVIGHTLTDGTVTLGADGAPPVAEGPATDTTFSKLSSAGNLEELVLFGSSPDTLFTGLTRSSNGCGDLLVGTFNGDLVINGETLSGDPQESSVISFFPAGLEWQPP